QARAGRPSATPGLQPRTPFSLPKAHPAVDRSSRHPEQPRGLGLCKALANRLHHKPAQSLLRLGRKRTSILSFHVPNDGPDSGTCQLFYAPISMCLFVRPCPTYPETPSALFSASSVDPQVHLCKEKRPLRSMFR